MSLWILAEYAAWAVSAAILLWMLADMLRVDRDYGTVTRELADPTWQGLGQTPQMQQAWETLGMTPETAAPAILTRFDYSIDPTTFGLTAFLLVAYFGFVIRISGREYRQVIAERFGEDEGEARR